jgi:predicted permease
MDWSEVWRRILPGRRLSADVRDEIAFHIEGRVRELVAKGWDEAEARAHALARFGDVAGVEEACRGYDVQRTEREGWRMRMEAWVRDVRLAVRGMGRSPAFTAGVVIILALGIGAATSVFSVVEGVILRPLPFAAPDRLVMVWENDRATGTTRENASPSDYYDFVERSRSLEGLAMYARTSVVLSRTGGDPVQLEAAQVTQGIFEVLGIQPAMGRGFTSEEDAPGGPPVAIVTHALWQEAFGGDPDILGRAVRLDGVPVPVVGVLPPGIAFPNREVAVWLPIRLSPAAATRANHWVSVVARLGAGATVAEGQAELSRIMSELEQEYPGENTNRGAYVEPLTDVGRADVRQTLWVLFAAVIAVLAIGCVNAVNLLLARGATRGREVAVHTAVGAGAGDLWRRYFVEGALLAGLAGAAGVGVAFVGVELLTWAAPDRLLLLGEPRVNASVLAFTVVASALLGVGFGLLPALQARRTDVHGELKDGRSSASRGPRLAVRRLLVAGQLALAVVLLVGATLLMGTLTRLHAVDPGFETANVLRMDFSLPTTRYPRDFSRWPEWTEVHTFNRAVVENAEALPGVQAASVVTNHPLDPGFTNSFRIEGRPYDAEQGEITTRLVTAGYFETVGLDLLDGRLPHPSDGPSDPHVIVLNRKAVERYFPEGGALGSRVGLWGQMREVVGIVEDERMHGLAEEVPPAVYVNLLQSPPVAANLTLLVRTEGPPLDAAPAVRRVVAALDPELAIARVSTMDDTLAEATARERFAARVFAVFAFVALVLSVLGVHGMLAYLVAQRGHEVGVRMALGATRRRVVRDVVEEGLAMAAPGVVLGVLGALALSRLLRGLLFGVSPTAPWAYGLAAVVLLAVAGLASAAPALRAASIPPSSALRGG